ncbi:MAG TPA: hypothetical protein VM658_14710 [bacterium]|nr:hypothetical protein [bacterium]
MEYKVLKTSNRSYPRRLKERLGREAPTLYFHGPLELLDGFTMGVICADAIPADAFWAGNEVLYTVKEHSMNYIGGWRSFYETEIFRMGNHRKLHNTVTCFSSKGLAHETFESFILDRFPPPVDKDWFERDEYLRRAREGELLMLSITEPDVSRQIRKNVMKRNFIACALADIVFIPYAEKGSKTLITAKAAVKAGLPCFTGSHIINQALYDLGIPGHDRKSLKKYFAELGVPQHSNEKETAIHHPLAVNREVPSSPQPKPTTADAQLSLDFGRDK